VRGEKKEKEKEKEKGKRVLKKRDVASSIGRR